MKIVLLGAGGYFPNRYRHTTCVCLPEIGVVFDAGTGMFRLPQWKQTAELDIFLSHAHLDHVVGLTYLLGLFPGESPELRRVHATQSTWDAISQHLFHSQLFPVAPPFEFRLLEQQTRLACGATVISFPLPHPGGSMGFRLEFNGRSMAYVTDTTAKEDAAYLPWIQDIELLIHEGYFDDGQEDLAERTGHSLASQAARLAGVCGAKRLVLIHMNPAGNREVPLNVDRLKSIFPNVLVGYDELTMEL